MRSRFAAFTLSALALVFSSTAFAASAPSGLDLAFSPHAAAVKQALAEMPRESGSAAMKLAANTESPACRTLRLQAASASSDTGSQRMPFPGAAREGRHTMQMQSDAGYGERAKLESRYLSECR
ncbi:MAG: hypothetical protein GAK35_02975 [Herbaspirillum frisingense]|uniref:DUF3617 family protein n=1 Tax=Herbaspirillum frisingense TaxID=92645 RepID=A0A7V8JTQ1_9BURK|nr:MAG: hypothetical protein GAK35_02975 [Herbaspirillum frisingense]